MVQTKTEKKMANNLTDRRDYVKIICGAGNEDPTIVHNICLIYSLAGADCFDVSCNPSIVASARRGIEQAFKIEDRFKWLRIGRR
jgi:hypothetical protein